MGFKALLRALGEESPSKKSQQKQAADLATEARKLKKESKEMTGFFGQLKQFKEFEKSMRDDIIEEQRETREAVEEAIEGFEASLNEQELMSQGFHPDSTSNERMMLSGLQLVSHHLTDWTSPKQSPKSGLDLNAKIESPSLDEPVSLEEVVDDDYSGLPPPPPPPPAPQGSQVTEAGKSANMERLMLFLDSMGIPEEQLAVFGVYPAKIDPSLVGVPWLREAAALIQQIQVE